MATGTILNKISDQASAMRDYLNEWAAQNGGTAIVVSNLSDMWAQASQSSAKAVIFICYMGEKVRGSFAEANYLNRVDREWAVMVKRGRGFYARRGDSLTESSVEIPFYDIVELLREKVRCMLNISMELPTIDFKGIAPSSQGNMVIDAYTITFTTANDIPEILGTPDNTPI